MGGLTEISEGTEHCDYVQTCLALGRFDRSTVWYIPYLKRTRLPIDYDRKKVLNRLRDLYKAYRQVVQKQGSAANGTGWPVYGGLFSYLRETTGTGILISISQPHVMYPKTYQGSGNSQE